MELLMRHRYTDEMIMKRRALMRSEGLKRAIDQFWHIARKNEQVWPLA